MTDRSESIAKHAALRFVVVSDIPAEHKRVLINVLTQALREDDAAELRRKSAEQTRPPWTPEGVARLQSLLEGKIARSWQHADEILMGTAAQLQREPLDVRSQATRLGLGRAVDYAVAKAEIVASD
jgi:hypothetical protein